MRLVCRVGVRLETAEKRVIGALLLLLGVSFFVVGWYGGQLSVVADFVKNIFPPAVAGMP
jgi:hypothetical protein